jgi:hypothetical protein
MNEKPGPLEEELSALAPHDPSPGLRQRIAKQLACRPAVLDSAALQGNRGQRWWRLAFAGGLAAAVLGGIMLWWWVGRGGEPQMVEQPQSPPPIETELPQPMLLAYRQALARSLGDFEALLDKQAVSEVPSNPEPLRIRMLTLPDERGKK